MNETVLHFNAPPTLDLDASGAGTGFTTTFTERDAPIPIVDTDVSITDPDNAALNSAKIVLTNAKPSDVLSIVGTLPGGIGSSINTSVPGQITINLFNSASLADYQAALGQIRFSNYERCPGYHRSRYRDHRQRQRRQQQCGARDGPRRRFAVEDDGLQR